MSTEQRYVPAVGRAWLTALYDPLMTLSTAKLDALREARRVFAPEGHIVIADWGQPHDRLMRAAFFMLQLLDGFQNTRDHAAGRLPSLVAQAGFGNVRVGQRWRTLWGSLEIITAEPKGRSVRFDCPIRTS